MIFKEEKSNTKLRDVREPLNFHLTSFCTSVQISDGLISNQGRYRGWGEGDFQGRVTHSKEGTKTWCLAHPKKPQQDGGESRNGDSFLALLHPHLSQAESSPSARSCLLGGASPPCPVLWGQQ